MRPFFYSTILALVLFFLVSCDDNTNGTFHPIEFSTIVNDKLPLINSITGDSLWVINSSAEASIFSNRFDSLNLSAIDFDMNMAIAFVSGISGDKNDSTIVVNARIEEIFMEDEKIIVLARQFFTQPKPASNHAIHIVSLKKSHMPIHMLIEEVPDKD
ncbi:MAG TPA: hypothetical protein ACFCUD_03495 [Cyclobacteriaceae bacterium]